MSSSRWDRVTHIFEAALERSPETRLQFIEFECAGDEELKSEILRLLTADHLAGSFLEKPAITVSAQKQENLKYRLFLPGSVVSSRFEIRRFIGQGGMAQVYEAFDTELNGKVAIKAIRPEISSDVKVLSRFLREVQITRRITHPNVCRTFDIARHTELENGVETQITFLTMELLEGETLANVLRRGRQYTSNEAIPLILQMIQGLSAAHNIGIVHRDFKPSNVLLVPQGTSIRAVVTDFGLARALGPQDQASVEQTTSWMTTAEGLVGTLVYMAPEQLERAESTAASDIYALGLVMYEMASGHRPFRHPIPFVEAMSRLTQDSPSLRGYCQDLDPRWEGVIARCLKRDPESRYRSVGEIGVALADDAGTTIPDLRLLQVDLHEPHKIPLMAVIFDLLRKGLFRRSILIFLLFVSLSVGFIRLIHWRAAKPKVPEGSGVLVTDISNETHDDELNGIGELLRSQLSQSAYMNLLESGRIKETLQRMAVPQVAPLAPKVAREVAWRAGVPLVVFGTVSRVAEDYKLDLKIEKVGKDPGRSVSSWNFSETATTKRDLFEAVHQGGIWVRRMVGETDTGINASDRKPDDVTTGNWEALSLYSDAQRLAAEDRLEDAVLEFKRATDKDPNFAMAWMREGDTLDNLGRSDQGFACWQRAIAISGDRRLSPREELRIKGMYASDTGDLKSAIDYFGQYSVAYPNDYFGYFFRAYPLMLVGHPEEAAQILTEAEKRAPDSYYIADHLARYHLVMGQFEQVAYYTLRLRQLGHSEYADQIDGLASVVKGDFETADGLFKRLHASTDSYLKSAGYYAEASAFAERGNYDAAIKSLQNGIDVDRALGDTGSQADKWTALAYLHAKLGEHREVRKAALESLASESDVHQIAETGTLLARSGFMADARRLYQSLPHDHPTVFEELVRHRLRGELLLAGGQCDGALQEFERARALDQAHGLLHDYWFHSLVACKRLREALEEVDRLRNRVGQVWQHPENYPPGYDADLLFEAAKLRYLLGDEDAKAQLSQYLSRRDKSTTPEVLEARQMYDFVSEGQNTHSGGHFK
jgi:serine/threonine protein kinase/tetratricopeptide (TPR) repeat protein